MFRDHMVDRHSRQSSGLGRRYRAPVETGVTTLSSMLRESGRKQLEPKQLALLRTQDEPDDDKPVPIYFSGDISLLSKPCVAIVGSRSASPAGIARAKRLARELVHSGFVVTSGLALGVDEAAHSSAISAGGNTVAVIGTPLDKAYPAQHSSLQEEIYSDHLLISPFGRGEKTFKSSFPKRNRVMAALTDATVIIEASDTSGTLHQAAECARLGRWLFILASLVENVELSWPRKFLAGEKVAILKDTSDLVRAVLADRE